jgi:hypothetical protein
MLSKEEKREAARKFKERKPVLGVFVVRCVATEHVWVGTSRNLSAEKNRCWFCLRNTSHLDRSLQQEWTRQGESAFEYEVLETLQDDISPVLVTDLLKEKKNHWIAQLNAQPL